MTAAFQPMPIQDDAQAVHPSMWVALCERVDTTMQRTGGFIADYGHGFAVDLVSACKLAVDDRTATAGGVA
jgi:hypothetical protein